MLRALLPQPLSVTTGPSAIKCGDQRANADFPGIDARHPAALAEYLARALPNEHLITSELTDSVATTKDFAESLSPAIQRSCRALHRMKGFSCSLVFRVFSK